LDEPFRFISANYRPAVKKMLEELSEKMQVQILMVTHASELTTGKVVEIGG
jgi:ABC-type sulfate/molybdate transport systems ATPase subunit